MIHLTRSSFPLRGIDLATNRLYRNFSRLLRLVFKSMALQLSTCGGINFSLVPRSIRVNQLSNMIVLSINPLGIKGSAILKDKATFFV